MNMNAFFKKKKKTGCSSDLIFVFKHWMDKFSYFNILFIRKQNQFIKLFVN